METKHSTGEWQWGRAGGDCSIYADRFCKKQIAQLTQIDEDNKCEEMDANAKLMAAAPTMLEALKEIAEGKGRYDTDKLKHAGNTIEDMIKLATDAIAFATREGN